MTPMLKPVTAAVLTLVLSSCASEWKIQGGPKQCVQMCRAWDMELTGMVGVGNQSPSGPGATACVCEVRRAAPQPAAMPPVAAPPAAPPPAAAPPNAPPADTPAPTTMAPSAAPSGMATSTAAFAVALEEVERWQQEQQHRQPNQH